MADPGALRVNAMLDASPFLGGISQMLGGLNEMSNGMKLASLAVGYFAFKTLKSATQELSKFQMEAVELKKILSTPIAEPIIESVRKLALTMPVARGELLDIAATAARLGITGRQNILKFTEVVAKIGIATDVSSGVAAESLARLAKQTRMPIRDMEGLGAAINELDNTMAVSSSGIIDASSRSAAELSRLGFTVPQILALNASLSEVSESASRAGTRLNRVAQELGNPKKADEFAAALGKTPEQFIAMRRTDPLGTLQALIAVMQRGGDTADELASSLDSRARRALQQFAQNAEGTEKALDNAGREFVEFLSLNREYAEVLDNVAPRQQIIKNNIAELKTEIGEELEPTIVKLQETFLSFLQTWNESFDDPLKEFVTEDATNKMKLYFYDLWATWEGGLTGAKYKTRKWFNGLEDHFLNVANFFLEEQYKFQTWHRANQQIQTDIVNIMGLVSEELQPVFFNMLQEQIEAAWMAGEGLEGFYKRMNEMGEAFTGLNFSGLMDNAAGMQMFHDQVQKLHAAYASGVITYRQYRNSMQSAIDIAVLNSDTMAGANEEQEEAAKVAEEHKKAVKSLQESLQDQYNKLVMTEEQLFKVSDGYKYASQEEQKTMLAKWRTIQALEAEAEAWEELKKAQERADSERENLEQSYRDEKVQLATDLWIRKQVIDGIQDEARARYEAQVILKYGLGDKHKELMLMYDEIAARDKILEQREKDARERDKDAKKAEQDQQKIADLIEKYTFATFESQLRLFERAVGDTADALLDTFEAIVTGSGNAADAVVAMITDIVRMILQTQLQRMLFNLFGPLLFSDWPGGGGGGGLKFDSRTGHPIRARAAGGRLEPSQLAIVGERGPELFVPDSAGTVIPNESFGQQPVNVNVSYQISALDSASVRDMLVREQKTISALTIDTINRHRTLKRI